MAAILSRPQCVKTSYSVVLRTVRTVRVFSVRISPKGLTKDINLHLCLPDGCAANIIWGIAVWKMLSPLLRYFFNVWWLLNNLELVAISDKTSYLKPASNDVAYLLKKIARLIPWIIMPLWYLTNSVSCRDYEYDILNHNGSLVPFGLRIGCCDGLVPSERYATTSGGVTKAPLVNFSVSKMFDLAKV